MKSFSEMLKGNQHKIDKNKNGKVDAHDFKLLRKMKKEETDVDGNQEQIDELSRDTLLSYANKVSLDSQKHSKDPTKRSGEKASRSVTGYARAHNRLEKPVKEDSDIEEQAPVAPSLVKHKISVTVSDPNHTMVSKRKEKIQKTVIVTHSDNKEGAKKVGEKFYVKKGYRVHDSHHAGMVNEEVEELDERNKENAMKRKSMDASRGARYKVSGNPVPDRDAQHSTAQAHNKAIGRALRKEEEELDEVKQATGDLKDACWKGYTAVGMKMKNGKKVPNCVPVKEEEELDETVSEGIGSAVTGAVSMVKNVIKKEKEYQAQKQKKAGEVLSKMRKEESELDEKMNMAKADMGDVIKDFQKSDAPQFAGKSKEKRRQMAIAAKLQADRMKKEGVEMKSYKQFMEELYSKLPEEIEEEVEVNEEAEQIDELDIKLLKSMQKHAKENPRPKSSSDDAIDPKTGRLKPYGYRGKSEYEKSETGDDDEPKKRGRKAGATVGSYKRRQPK